MTERNPREEAERLVAAALASASIAVENLQSRASTAGFATGSAECCVCPVCKAIASVRDPSPEFVERLATGAGDLAVGLAGVLRAFASTTAQPGTPRAEPEDVWSAATSGRAQGSAEPAAPPPPGTPPPPEPDPPVRPPMAKKAVKPKKAAPPPAPPSPADADSTDREGN